MTATPLLIAQISDLHIKPAGELAYQQVDTAAALKRCIMHLNRMWPRPAMVVASGDLVDGGRSEEYAHLKRLLADLALPLVALPGNHDARDTMRRAFPNQPYAQSKGPMNFHIAVGPLDLILIDSSVTGQDHGAIEDETLVWLEATLNLSPKRPALLFLHHPPFATGIRYMDAMNLQNAADLATILRRYPRARMIGCGHVHRAIYTQFAGCAASICPAPNHAVALDLSLEAAPALIIEPPAIHLHAWFDGSDYGDVVTHLVPIGAFGGPRPFDAADGKPTSSPVPTNRASHGEPPALERQGHASKHQTMRLTNLKSERR
jgi:3',5'-cyclic-AMP phosphodiesterase